MVRPLVAFAVLQCEQVTYLHHFSYHKVLEFTVVSLGSQKLFDKNVKVLERLAVKTSHKGFELILGLNVMLRQYS